MTTAADTDTDAAYVRLLKADAITRGAGRNHRPTPRQWLEFYLANGSSADRAMAEVKRQSAIWLASRGRTSD